METAEWRESKPWIVRSLFNESQRLETEKWAHRNLLRVLNSEKIYDRHIYLAFILDLFTPVAFSSTSASLNSRLIRYLYLIQIM